MSSKKKSHGLLLTPYLEKGEDLIWVGSPEKNSLIFLRPRETIITYWLIASTLLLFIIGVLVVQGIPTSLWINPWTLYLGIFWLLGFFFFGFLHFGNIYYAITTKRLLILRHQLWTSLDAALLMILPAHHLKLSKYKTSSIEFEPIRIDEAEFVDRYTREVIISVNKIRRQNMEHLSQEDAETANELLTAVKNDMLDERARELGLMD